MGRVSWGHAMKYEPVDTRFIYIYLISFTIWLALSSVLPYPWRVGVTLVYGVIATAEIVWAIRSQIARTKSAQRPSTIRSRTDAANAESLRKRHR